MTAQPLVVQTTDMDLRVLNPEVLYGRGLLLVPHDLEYVPLGPDVHPLEARAPEVLEVIQEHRRVNNVRRCSGPGCDWRPVAAGRNGDPDAMLARHRQFNEHLANLIVRSLAGC